MIQLDVGFRISLRVREKLVSVEIRISQELENRAVELVSAAFGGDVDGRTAVASFLRSGVVGGHLVFLDIVWRQAIQIRQRVGHGGFVGLNAVDGDVESAVAGTVHGNTGPGASSRALRHARL